MSVSIYEATVPVFSNGLRTLAHLLTQASAHAASTGVDADAVMAPARLIADMQPLAFQVLVATNTAKLSLARLTGVSTETWPDTEKTIEQLQARVAKTLSLLNAQTPDAFAAAADIPVHFQLGPAHKPIQVAMTGKQYVFQYALPNFFFHLQTAYAILRTQGVPIGKKDYLGSFMEGANVK